METTQTGRWLSPSKTHQLYNTVAVAVFTYASNMWYTPPFKLPHSRNTWGSVQATKLIQSIQGHMLRFITGGLHDTAFDVLEVHTNIPPIDLLF